MIRRSSRRAGWFAPALGATLALALAFLVLPVVAVFTNTSPARLVDSLGRPLRAAPLLPARFGFASR